MGDGWWIASDGRWYPAEAHPDAFGRSSPAGDATTGHAAGWWKASDGNWYAPELHADNIATISLPLPAPRTAVTRRSSASPDRSGADIPEWTIGAAVAGSGTALASNGLAPASNGLAPASNGLALSGSATALASNGTALFGSETPLARNGTPLANSGTVPTNDGAVARSNGTTDPSKGVGKRGAAQSAAVSRASRTAHPTGELDSGPMLDPLTPFDERNPPPAAAPPTTRADQPATARRRDPLSRPLMPGFEKSNGAPSGSTVRQVGAPSAFRQHPEPVEHPRTDGFDEWLQSISPMDPTPRLSRGNALQQRSDRAADRAGARTTAGGPRSSVPRVSSSESDFFVLKPSHKKARTEKTKPRTKLSAAVFVLVLLIVIVAVVVAFLYLHVHR